MKDYLDELDEMDRESLLDGDLDIDPYEEVLDDEDDLDEEYDDDDYEDEEDLEELDFED